jgi:hypothetical protein
MGKMKKIIFGILAITLLFLGTVESNGASARGISPQEIVMNA